MLTGIRLVSEAADLAARRHNGMARKGRGNEPYINHLAEVANLLALVTDGADAELVAAGWLHDTIEDTGTTRAELAQKFGVPTLQVREGPGTKLQWSKNGCVIDVYLYPPDGARGPDRSTYADARRTSGADISLEACLAFLAP